MTEQNKGLLPTPEEIKALYITLPRFDIDSGINKLTEAFEAQLAKAKPIIREMTLKEVGRGEGSPKIICLCGSTRFTDLMLVKQWELTKQGFVVLSWCALPDWYFSGEDKSHIGDQEDVKEVVDTVHLRKIDIADEVMILNVDGYIGESTRAEIEYAQSKGKPIKYLEALKQGEMPEK